MDISAANPTPSRHDSEPGLPPHPASQQIPAWQIKEALSDILESDPFRASRQSQKLLRYIVDMSLAGDINLLKERMIGIEVFDRRPDYDTNADPIVRARVAEVRKRLAVYYQNKNGNTVRISVPHGSFRAVFEWTEEKASHHSPAPSPEPAFPQVNAPAAETDPPQLAAPHDSALPAARGLKRFWWIAAIVVFAVSAFFAHRLIPSAEQRALSRFWAPILNDSRTALVYVGGNAVYQLTPSYLENYFKQHPRTQNEEMGFETYIQWPPGAKIDAQDLLAAKDTFVTIGDVAAIAKIESLLVRRDRQFDIRYGGDVTYGDLRQSPTILVGAHNNSWTLTMTENLRYAFDGRNAIVDRTNPQKRWSTTDAFTEDYAIVSRILNSKTGTSVMAIGGIGYAGTEAAAEFLTNPQSIASLVKTLPAGWEKKNSQIVLHTTVTNQLPSAPDVVAAYCW